MYQVLHGLRDQALVCRHWRNSVGRLLDQTDALLFRGRLKTGNDLAHDVIEFEGDLQHFLLVFPFQLRDGQEGIDHARHTLGLVSDDRDELSQVFRHRIVCDQQFRETIDAGERRAQLMRHQRDHVTLQLLVLFQLGQISNGDRETEWLAHVRIAFRLIAQQRDS